MSAVKSKKKEEEPTASDTKVDKPSIPDRPKVWHAQHCRLLKQWADVASIYRWMHYETHQHYAWLNFWFTLPTIIISSITGTLNFAQSSFPAEYATLLPLGIGTLNLIAGAVTTIASYLRVSELSEGNRVASISFGKLSRNIRTELLLPSGQRTMDGADFIQMCRIDLDRLTEQTPDIPDKIVTAFNRKFEKAIKSDKFYLPEISVLQPVEIYTDEKEEKEQRIARIVSSAAHAFHASPKTSPTLPPAVEVTTLNFAPLPPPLAAVDPVQARNMVREELQGLSKIGAVSSRISHRLVQKAKEVKADVKANLKPEDVKDHVVLEMSSAFAESGNAKRPEETPPVVTEEQKDAVA